MKIRTAPAFPLVSRDTGPALTGYRVILPVDQDLASRLQYALVYGDSDALWDDRPDTLPWFVGDDDGDRDA